MSFTTHESLLLRLRCQPADEDAWDRFVTCYEPLIDSWCRKHGLAEADAQDVCQDVLTKLVTTLRTFSYDSSKRFRGWLQMVVRNALNDYQRQRLHEPTRGSGDTRVLELLVNREARDDLLARLDRAFDLERFDRAMATVQAKVSPHNWRAFVLTELEGRSIPETAAGLGLDAAAVYVARCKIRKMLKRQIDRMEARNEESSTDDVRRLSDPGVLREYLDNSLDPRPGDPIVAHLAACPRCRKLLEDPTEHADQDRWRALWALRDEVPSVENDEARSEDGPSDSEPRLPASIQVEGFEVLGLLGRGGSGVVYRARQVKLDRLVALKMLTAGAHASRRAIKRFREESMTIARLRHPQVVAIHDVGEHQGVP